ncbi:MAG: hypothetical protein Q3993_00770 [Filifactor alocis]|nr:hypothetical protein [Filifactor alocis]
MAQKKNLWLPLLMVTVAVGGIFLESVEKAEEKKFEALRQSFEQRRELKTEVEEEEEVELSVRMLIDTLEVIGPLTNSSLYTQEGRVMLILEEVSFDRITKVREELKSRGYRSYVSEGKGKKYWDELILVVEE